MLTWLEDVTATEFQETPTSEKPALAFEAIPAGVYRGRIRIAFDSRAAFVQHAEIVFGMLTDAERKEIGQ